MKSELALCRVSPFLVQAWRRPVGVYHHHLSAAGYTRWAADTNCAAEHRATSLSVSRTRFQPRCWLIIVMGSCRILCCSYYILLSVR